MLEQHAIYMNIKLIVEYDPDTLDEGELFDRLNELDYEITETSTSKPLKVIDTEMTDFVFDYEL